MGNEIPGAEAGDLVVKVGVKKHKHFERNGADLLMAKEITLKQALLGFSFTLKYLDGKDLVISSVPGEVIEFGAAKSVKGKGLPFYKKADGFGNLIINFEVLSPKYIELSSTDAISCLDEVVFSD